MAHRKMIATHTGRYGTRMLTADEPLMMSGPESRLAMALGRARPADDEQATAPAKSDEKPAPKKPTTKRRRKKASG